MNIKTLLKRLRPEKIMETEVSETPLVGQSVWAVQGGTNKSGHGYRNLSATVLAATLSEAADKVLAQNPDATLYSIQHRGKLTIS